MADKDVKIKIVTEYDGSGAAKAKADMAAMGKQSGKSAGGSGSGSSVDPAVEAQKAAEAAAKAAAKEAEKAAKEVEKQAEKAAKAASKEAEKVAKEAEKQAREIEKQAAAAAKAAEREAEKQAREIEKQAAAAAKAAEREAERAAKAVAKESAAAAKAAEKEAEKIAKAAVATSAEAIAGSKDIEAAATEAAKLAATEALAAGKSVEDAASAATAASQAAIAKIAKDAPAATASVGGLTKGFKFGRMAAAAFASTAGKAFAWIGLINQCIELLKTLWAWWNKSDEEQQKKRAEEMERQAQATRDAKVAFEALQDEEAETRYLERRQALATRYGRTLERQLRTLRNMSEQEQIQLNLAALKLSNERDAEELRLQTQLATGEISESQFTFAMQEVDQQRQRDELANRKAQLEKDMQQAKAEAAVQDAAYDEAVKEQQKYELGDDMFMSYKDYDAARKLVMGLDFDDSRRIDFRQRQAATGDFMESMDIDTRNMGAAFTELGRLHQDAEAKAKAAAKASDTWMESYDEFARELEQDLPVRSQLLAESQEKARLELTQQEDARVKEQSRETARAVQDEKARQAGDLATRYQGKADELASGLGVGTNATKVAREAAAALLAALKDDPKMLQVMGQYAMGKPAPLSAAQRDMYGEQLGVIRRADGDTRKQVWEAASAQYSATRHAGTARALQEGSQELANDQQTDSLTKARRDNVRSQEALLKRENAELLQQIEDLTQTMNELLSNEGIGVDELAKLKADISALKAEGRANNQKLKNLKWKR
ncbi:MAG: hypothetical protein R3Y56_06010 [Akkermansia sp.]